MKCNYGHLPSAYLLIFGFLLSVSLSAADDTRFSNQVNLALRQTGHLLLLQQNDSTTVIPPVNREGDQGYLLRLHGTLDYSALPALLKKSLADYGIDASFELVVRSCNNQIPLLGFNKLSMDRDSVPCTERNPLVECADIFIQFENTDAGYSSGFAGYAMLFIPLGGLGYYIFRKKKKAPAVDSATDYITLGQYQFDPKNQHLKIGQQEYQLTFRESKLLLLFANNPNKVLTRNDILAAVWEDEGVVVGRSPDVFISRLRKLLRHDPAVQLKNVHGVGYRLELP